MAERQGFLGGNPFVGDNSHQGGHKDGDKTLGGKEKPNVVGKSDFAQEAAHTGQICPPHSILEDIHQYEPECYIRLLHKDCV